MNERPTRFRRRLGVAVLAVGSLLTMAACGGDEPAAEPQAAMNAEASTPGVFGEIVAIDDTTAQVRSAQSGQTAVTWTAETSVLNQVEISATELDAGDCVMVMLDSEAEDTAARIQVSEPVDGSCAPAGGPGRPGDDADRRPEGMDGERPEVPEGERPSDAPERGDGSGGADGGFSQMVSGEVTKVSAEQLVVEVMARPEEGDDTTEPQTEERTIVLGSDTTILAVVEADVSALEVGRCAAAEGDTDDTGALTAQTITISSPVDGECAGLGRAQFGGPGGRGGAPGEAPSEDAS